MAGASALRQGECTVRVWPDDHHLRARHLASPTPENTMLEGGQSLREGDISYMPIHPTVFFPVLERTSTEGDNAVRGMQTTRNSAHIRPQTR